MKLADLIKQYVDELRQPVIAAKLNYEIWWLYKEKDSRQKYLDVIRCH
jgi:hypothetical protein